MTNALKTTSARCEEGAMNPSLVITQRLPVTPHWEAKIGRVLLEKRPFYLKSVLALRYVFFSTRPSGGRYGKSGSGNVD
jgi:hypothetical protein